ncbi:MULTISPECIES: alkaline shock response membrane anchor protein AmaP [unclassified Frankia]|uniref:alkaline shock response membrane anchor protein AmaP n=2 Tax=Frankia TaxID=1854 RepID=UPI001EF566AD|nr:MULTISPECIES: alkaline shock response membrane anchor protein AmaP [unclassified Frankia]
MNATVSPTSARTMDSPIPQLGPPIQPDEVSMIEPTGSAKMSRPRRQPFAPGVDLLNRVVFVLLGLVCLGGGAVALLAGRGVFGDDVAARYGLTAQNRSFAAEHVWFWPVAGAVTGLVVLLALAWLWLQKSTGNLPGLYVVDDTFGRVRVNARAFTGAVEGELATLPGVRQVRARLLGTGKRPLLRVVVTMKPSTDVRRIRADIERAALPHARGALSRADLATEIQLIPHPGHGDRVY